jgi:CHAT domain-containing protein
MWNCIAAHSLPILSKLPFWVSEFNSGSNLLPMDTNQLLQQLRDLSLEEGRRLIVEHDPDLSDHTAFGVLLADEALQHVFINPAVSLKLAEILTFFGDRVHHLSSHALGLKAKGDALRVIGFHQAAIDCLDTAGTEFLQVGDEENWARSRISWILAAAWLGRVDEALQEAKRARAAFIRIGQPYWACIVDSNTALIYEYIGRYHDALVLYQQILAVYRTLPDQNDQSIKRQVAIAKCNQAIALAMLGDFEDAYRLQQQARASFIELNETSCVINTDLNLADLDYTQGYYGSALRHFYDALDTMSQNEIDEPPLLALFKLLMANCLMKLNRIQEACQLAEEAVAIQRQLDMSLQKSDALREYATILIVSGNLQQALTTLDEARALLSNGKLHYYAAITELLQAEVLLTMGRATEAYERAYRLKVYFDTQILVARSVRAAIVMASALTAIGQTEDRQQAITLSKQAVTQARQYNLQEEVYKSYHLLGRLFALQGDTTKATWHYSAAIAQIERMLDHLGFDLSPTFLHTTWTVYEEMITLCLQQSQFTRAFGYLERARSTALRQHLHMTKASREHGETYISAHDTPDPISQATGMAILRLQQELNAWQERYRQYSTLLADAMTLETFSLDRHTVEQELTRCEAKLSDLFERLHLYQTTGSASSQSKQKATAHPYRVDITKLRQQLRPEQCLLAYFMFQEKLVIFVLTADSLVTHEVPGAVLHLERQLLLLHAHLQAECWSDIQHPPQEAIRRLLHKLYTILITPMIDMLPSHINSLIIVPYGPLHDLPFHALHDGHQFLIERFQVSYLLASSLLSRMDNAQDKSTHHSIAPSPTAYKSPLIFGYAGNGHARCMLDEATTLADVLGGTCYLEQEATIGRLITNAPGSPIIHIATHGRVRLDAPHFSSVLLADGQFNALDAFQLDIKACELVTLSGCDTGKALIGGGDEQLGLGRAFLAAGARSLVMSLWPVEDTVTNVFMQHFYLDLLDGKTRAEALRAAQCHLLHHQSPRYAHPYFWAAFRLVGETGALTIAQKPVASALHTQVT